MKQMLLLALVGCGQTLTSLDAGEDATTDAPAAVIPCDEGCPSGMTCFLAIDAGCSASSSTGICATPMVGACKGRFACGCDGVNNITVCGGPPGYTNVPYDYLGFCDAGTD